MKQWNIKCQLIIEIPSHLKVSLTDATHKWVKMFILVKLVAKCIEHLQIEQNEIGGIFGHLWAKRTPEDRNMFAYLKHECQSGARARGLPTSQAGSFNHCISPPAAARTAVTLSKRFI